MLGIFELIFASEKELFITNELLTCAEKNDPDFKLPKVDMKGYFKFLFTSTTQRNQGYKEEYYALKSIMPDQIKGIFEMEQLISFTESEYSRGNLHFSSDEEIELYQNCLLKAKSALEIMYLETSKALRKYLTLRKIVPLIFPEIDEE